MPTHCLDNVFLPAQAICKLAWRLQAAWAPFLDNAMVSQLGKQALKARLMASDPAFTEGDMKTFIDNGDRVQEMRPLDGEMSHLERFVHGNQFTHFMQSLLEDAQLGGFIHGSRLEHE